MRQNFENELSPEVKEKMKKNLVYIGIFSVIMLFAGLTSAYYVSMSDSFWLKTPFPQAFFISTAIIVLSSITFILGVQSAKKGKASALKIYISITLLLGVGFVYYQFKGYKAFIDNGVVFIGKNILVNEGRYGDYFTLKYKGNHLEVDANNYYLEGKTATENQKAAISDFSKQFIVAAEKNGLTSIQNYGKEFILLYKDQPLTYLDGKLLLPDGKELEYLDLARLGMFAQHLADGRGDFFVKGEIGKDFRIYYKGTELTYKDRALYKGNQKLSAYLQNSASSTPDTANSYLYLITFLHLMHIVVTLIFMIKTVIYSFRGKYTNGDTIGLRATGIFWHFLGLLWVYLLLFLLFIH